MLQQIEDINLQYFGYFFDIVERNSVESTLYARKKNSGQTRMLGQNILAHTSFCTPIL